jgi:drug/metabolite transporter (DMT)-like permease
MLLRAPLWLRPFWHAGLSLRGLRDSIFPPDVKPLYLFMIFCWGAPFAFFASNGLLRGEVALGAALTPGAMPLWAAIIGFFLFATKPTGRARWGLLLIALGILLSVGPLVFANGWKSLAGAEWFSVASISWALFAIAFPRTGLSPARAAGLVGFYATVCIAFYVPFDVALGIGATRFLDISAKATAFAFFSHGLLAGVISVLAYSEALRRLGPGAAMLAALVPGLATLMGYLFLGESPGAWQWGAIGAASAGVALTQFAAAKSCTKPFSFSAMSLSTRY